MAIPVTSGFPVPPQKPPGPGSFDPSTKAVSSWLAALPKAHPEVAAEKLLDMVHEVNRLEIPHDLRLRLLQSLDDQGYSILDPLYNKLRDITSPAHKKEVALAELLILLHQELALAYRSAIKHASSHKPLHKDLTSEHSRLVRNSLLHLGRSQQVHYLLKSPPKTDVWGKIYTLYTIAADTGVLKKSAAEHEKQAPATIEGTFKAILLMFLSAPESLRSIELDDLRRLIPELVQYPNLLPAEETAANEPVFLIDVGSGSIPRLDRGSSSTHANRQYSPECLKLDVAPLLSEIRHRLTAIYKHQERPSTQQVLRRKMLEHLLRHLEPQRKRLTQRLSGEFEVEVIAGFRQVHRFLTDDRGLPGRDAIARKKATKRGKHSTAWVEYDVVLNLELVDIESPMMAADNKRTHPVNEVKPDVRRAFCKTLNFSRDGYCLATEGTDNFHLKVGELVAVREKNEDRWLPGNACWVTSDGYELRFGITLMAPFLQPGKALSLHDQDAKEENCILLTDSKNGKPTSILLCPPGLPAGTPLSVEAGGKALNLKLQRELSRTPGYVEFHCDGITEQGAKSKTTPLFDNIPIIVLPE